MLINQNEYLETVETIKHEIQSAQYRAAVRVNSELVLLYYHIGQVINSHKSWGNHFIDDLSKELRIAFPQSKGYSVRNLKYMAKLAALYPDEQIMQQAVAQIPWGHNVVLMDKIRQTDIALWYAQKTKENGWSRNVLVHQIESQLYD